MDPATDLDRALRLASGVRFLCSGNVVRSAFAELYARHLKIALPVDSAATRFDSPELFPQTRAALLARGVAPELIAAFRPRPLWRIPEPPAERLVVLGMSPEHLAAWRARFPSHGQTFLLREIEGAREPVADPVLEGADFTQAFETIARCVGRLIGRF